MYYAVAVLLNDVDLTIASPTKPGHSSDPFADAVLSRDKNQGHMILGIGDPTRLTATEADHRHVTPRIAGTLIKKTCFWMLDEKPEPFEKHTDKYVGIITHPAGFTAHAIVFHHLLHKLKNAEAVKQRILQLAHPSLGMATAYDFFRRRWPAARRPEHRIAYISDDPLEALAATGGASDKPLVHDYVTQCTEDVVMTALIVGDADRWSQDSGYKSTAHEVIEALNTSLILLYERPEWWARTLHDQIHRRGIGQGGQWLPRFARDWSPAELGRCARFLAEQKIYPADILTVSKNAWEQTKLIRRSVEPHLGHATSLNDLDKLCDFAASGSPVTNRSGPEGHERATAALADYDELWRLKQGATNLMGRELASEKGTTSLALWVHAGLSVLVLGWGLWTNRDIFINHSSFYELNNTWAGWIGAASPIVSALSFPTLLLFVYRRRQGDVGFLLATLAAVVFLLGATTLAQFYGGPSAAVIVPGAAALIGLVGDIASTRLGHVRQLWKRSKDRRKRNHFLRKQVGTWLKQLGVGGWRRFRSLSATQPTAR